MKPEYKMVAATVVLSAVVVMAAVVVMKLPRWKQKAKAQHQESVLQGMTPDKAIALCGHPVLDEAQASQPTVSRRLIIRNDYALAVELDFAASSAEPQTRRLSAIQDTSRVLKPGTPSHPIRLLLSLD